MVYGAVSLVPFILALARSCSGQATTFQWQFANNVGFNGRTIGLHFKHRDFFLVRIYFPYRMSEHEHRRQITQ